MTRPTQKEVELARIRAVCGMIYNKDGPDEVFRAWIVRVYDAYLELEAEREKATVFFDRSIAAMGCMNDQYRTQLTAMQYLLADFHARMHDTYDGAPDSNNRMPFSGSDLYELERVLIHAEELP